MVLGFAVHPRRCRGAPRAGLGALAACALGACAQTPPPVSVTVVLRGSDDLQARMREALRGTPEFPLEPRFAELPNVPTLEIDAGDADERLSAARADYVAADFARCAEDLAGFAVADLLGAGRRTTAARVLFWRTACLVGGGDPEGAAREARSFAVLGLDVPPDVEAATPEVEAALALALRETAEAPRVPVRIVATLEGAAVSVDGRAALCVTPCTVDVPPGDHVIGIESDGVTPESRLVRVGADPIEAPFEPVPAPPELAARQWTGRYAGAPAIDSTPSVQLLARAVRARRLVVLSGEHEGSGVRLRAVLAVDEAVAARTERSVGAGSELVEETLGVLRDLLVSGGILEPAPTLVERPMFWVAVGIAAALAGGATAAALFEPDTRTEVFFR